MEGLQKGLKRVPLKSTLLLTVPTHTRWKLLKVTLELTRLRLQKTLKELDYTHDRLAPQSPQGGAAVEEVDLL